VIPEEVPDATPALAWVPDYLQPAVETDVARALRGSYEAIRWLQLHAGKFALFAKVTSVTLAQQAVPTQQQQQQQQERQGGAAHE
jgi:hypothetical protein